jgi:hypothetical protein
LDRSDPYDPCNVDRTLLKLHVLRPFTIHKSAMVRLIYYHIFPHSYLLRKKLRKWGGWEELAEVIILSIIHPVK